MMRTIFFGSTELGYCCCEELLNSGQEIVAIFSIPRDFRISYSAKPVHNVTFRGFEDLAKQHDIPLIYVEGKLTDRTYARRIEEFRPDFGLAIGWYYLFPREFRKLFPMGIAGIHASLLPKYRGGAPLVWAIINGETESGVTLFYMEDGIDTGDIIGQERFMIDRTDTIREVYRKATDTSVKLVKLCVPMIEQRSAPRLPQDHESATVYPQRKPEDGRIDWSQDPESIYDFIRAQTKPYPGAFTTIEGKRVIIWDAEIMPEPASEGSEPPTGS